MRPGRRSHSAPVPVVWIAAIGALIGAGVLARATTGDAPDRRPPRGSSLAGMACASSTWCLSVGSMGSIYGVQVPLAVESTGRGWSARSPRVPVGTGDSALLGIDCTAPRSCVAVGHQEVPTAFFGQRSAGDRPLAATWNGTSWRVGQGPAPRSTTEAVLNAVSCAGSTCMAVGEYKTRQRAEQGLAASFDGTAWTLRMPPVVRHTEQLEDVVLQDVACVSPTDCTAVGYFSYELEFLGQRSAPLIERWDGRAWHPERGVGFQESPDTELNAVSCLPDGSCVAVGFVQRPNRVFAPFAELRVGGTWTFLQTSEPPGSTGSELSDVACPRRRRCTAVGSIVTSTGFQGFAETWDDGRWTVEQVPRPPDTRSTALTTVDCPGPAECRAAGVSYHRSPIGRAFSVSWDGAVWSVVPVPAPATGG
jgi:hypothetical protein